MHLPVKTYLKLADSNAAAPTNEKVATEYVIYRTHEILKYMQIFNTYPHTLEQGCIQNLMP